MIKPILFAALMPCAAAAQSNCHLREMVVHRLADVYGETRQSIGLAANNTIVEVFASHETGTWTITVTHPGGPTCLVASGEGFQVLAETHVDGDPT